MRLPLRLATAAGLALAGIAAFLGLGGSPLAQPAQGLAGARKPIVVELFTSQSCSSCPPAEALFRDFAQRPDLIALEWHVDYWDGLNVAGAGRWKDPYSKPEWTERQRLYAQNISGGSNVYTPQAVIDGHAEAEGFNRPEIEKKAADAARTSTGVSITATRATELNFKVTGAPAGTEATLVTFRAGADTDVRGGENKGRKLSSSHLVTATRELGILHKKNQGAILAATYCPT
jgi:hypothetical protein